nr:hypothetical protein [Tanacetum cinerariifolium]
PDQSGPHRPWTHADPGNDQRAFRPLHPHQHVQPAASICRRGGGRCASDEVRRIRALALCADQSEPGEDQTAARHRAVHSGRQ